MPLLIATIESNDIERVFAALEEGAIISNTFELNHLANAIILESYEIVQLLIDRGAKISQRPRGPVDHLELALDTKRYDIIGLLLIRGANPTLVTKAAYRKIIRDVQVIIGLFGRSFSGIDSGGLPYLPTELNREIGGYLTKDIVYTRIHEEVRMQARRIKESRLHGRPRSVTLKLR